MALIFTAMLAGATAWPTYANARFGYSTCYPAAFKPQQEADNADGRKFLDEKGAELLVFGQYAVDISLADWTANEAGTYTGNRGRITYRAGKVDWIVLSGDDGAKFQFYIKAVKRDDRFVTMQLKYPRAKVALYRPIVERLARCLVVDSPPF
ncbi:hypothetical protein [Novosphingobium cyanobacteriorum]|uniref:Uncharacterized protein n=1 Tax=Novosphingobium cyanobacteriorum TaxID=3024215 RepID=A0ABT6CG97_9SPHN|nr:hypothetical protein [Novosphingobium cyanobacteriorum]MDF8332847.1 hypothetical protein [Novosphingobium cyanobacteriorum]